MDAPESPPTNPQRGYIFHSGGKLMFHSVLKQNMDAPESPPESPPAIPQRRYTFRTGRSKKRKAQTNVPLNTGGTSFRRPITRSQAKLFAEHAIRQKLGDKRPKRCLSYEIVQVESSAETTLDWPPTRRENEENNVVSEAKVEEDFVLGAVPPSGGNTMAFVDRDKTTHTGVPLRRCSSVDTLIVINSWTENAGCLSNDTEPLNIDNCVTSSRKVEDANEVIDTSEEHHPRNFQGNNHDLRDSSPLMSSIISKHGDITKSCIFQSQIFKSTCVEAVCKVVKNLQENKHADVNSDFLKEFYSFIEDAKRISLDVKWLSKYVDEAEDPMKSTIELQKLEEAESELAKVIEDKQKAIKEKKVHVAGVQSEIAVEEDELALAIQNHKELKERISRVKSGY